jgi:hypothetical protein
VDACWFGDAVAAADAVAIMAAAAIVAAAAGAAGGIVISRVAWGRVTSPAAWGKTMSLAACRLNPAISKKAATSAACSSHFDGSVSQPNEAYGQEEKHNSH